MCLAVIFDCFAPNRHKFIPNSLLFETALTMDTQSAILITARQLNDCLIVLLYSDTFFILKGEHTLMKRTIKLQDLDCANCAAKVETAIAKLPDVTDVKVNFMRQKLILEAPDDRFDAVLAEAKKTANKIEPELEFLD